MENIIESTGGAAAPRGEVFRQYGAYPTKEAAQDVADGLEAANPFYGAFVESRPGRAYEVWYGRI